MYDIITIPFYYYIQKPWRLLAASQKAQAKQSSNASNSYGAWMRTTQPPKSLIDGCENVNQLFDRVVATYGTKQAFGYRPVLAESSDVQANGRVFKKYVLGDYVWNNFNEMQERVNHLSSGFLQQGKTL